MHSRWTKIGAERPLVPHVIKRDLTPALSKKKTCPGQSFAQADITPPDRLNPVIDEEVDLAFRDELPPCKDFTPVPLNEKLLRIIAKVSGRVFVGPELCRSEEYMDMAINYTMEVVKAQRAINVMKPWQRILFGNSVPEVKTLHERLRTSKEYIKPVIATRKKAAAEDPDFRKPDDILQWILDDGHKFGNQEDDDVIDAQLGLTFAAIHTTTMTTTNACVDIPPSPTPLSLLELQIIH